MKWLGLSLSLALFASVFSVALSAQTTLDDFENTGTWSWSPWVQYNSGGTKSSTQAHGGTYSLYNPGWHYRTDVNLGGAGHKLECWVYPTGSGRTYFGFAASSTGCYSLVLSPNTTEFLIQQNSSYGYSNVATVTQSYTYNQWYKLEITWNSTTSVTGRLYGSNGTTLINTVNYSTTTAMTGGVAIRAFGNHYVDDMAYVSGANLEVTATQGTRENLYANATGGGNGVEVGAFSIENKSSSQGGTLTAIDIDGSGSGTHATAYSNFSIYRESNANTQYDAGVDTLVGTGTFSGTSTTINVTGSEQSFSASETKDYYIVVQLNGTPTPAQTFDFEINDLSVGTNTSKAGIPSSQIDGFTISAPAFTVADNSAATAQSAFLGSSGNVVQEFTIAYPNGPDDHPTSLTITGLGTANESTDLSDVELWYDSNSNGTFESTNDTMVDNGSFAADNGTVVFDMSAHPDFQAGDTRTFFVVYDLNTSASDAETFKCYVSAVSGQATGTTVSGTPAPGTSGTAGLTVSALILTASLNGPGAATTIPNNSSGPTGDGEVLADVSLTTAPGGNWTVNSLTFLGTGTGNFQTDITTTALYEDTNANGTFDGAATDLLAAPALGAFNASNQAVFSLNNTTFTANTTRRFFVTVIMAGTATAGESFNARLDSIGTTPPPGGQVNGTPTATSTALIIDTAALSVMAGAANPAAYTHKSGTALTHPMMQVSFSASNNSINVTGFTLTTGGTGNWTTAFTAATGVQVWQDDGDNVFNATTDTQLDATSGATPSITFSLGAGVSVANGATESVWVVFEVEATAGAGASQPITFNASIANASDVTAGGGTVMLGTPTPNSNAFSIVDFDVTNFTPNVDYPAGGANITIDGSGFIAPITVRINGVVCPGTASISGTGTQVTGLMVPPGSGTNLTIEMDSGTLPTQTLSQTFSYSNNGPINGGGGGSGGGGGGCSCASDASPHLAPWWLMALLGIGALAFLRLRASKE